MSQKDQEKKICILFVQMKLFFEVEILFTYEQCDVIICLELSFASYFKLILNLLGSRFTILSGGDFFFFQQTSRLPSNCILNVVFVYETPALLRYHIHLNFNMLSNYQCMNTV